MNRSPGRPRLDDDDDSVPVHVTMTATQYNETYQRAQRERVSVPEVIRRALQRDASTNKKT